MPIKILIVEDEQIIALDTKLRLEGMGYQVDTAASGEMALKIIENNSFDIVLMDVTLNGKLDGIDTAVLIRNSYSNLLVIYITGNIHLDENEKIELTKPYECLSKPLEDTELERVIENYVEACV